MGFDAGALAAVSQAISGVGSIASSYSQSQAISEQGKYESRQLRSNAEIAKLQAQDAIRRGEKEEQDHRKQVRKLISRQRAIMGAQGLDLESGTALQLQEETASLGALDALTIRNNAYREAWGYKAQAANLQSQSRFERLSARGRAQSTLLTGGLSFARDLNQAAWMYDQYGKKT